MRIIITCVYYEKQYLWKRCVSRPEIRAIRIIRVIIIDRSYVYIAIYFRSYIWVVSGFNPNSLDNPDNPDRPSRDLGSVAKDVSNHGHALFRRVNERISNHKFF